MLSNHGFVFTNKIINAAVQFAYQYSVVTVRPILKPEKGFVCSQKLKKVMEILVTFVS